MDPWRYKQVVCTRDLSGTNFPNGELKFSYRMPSNKQINLDKSFIKVRCSLSKADGTKLTLDDDIAPNYLTSYGLIRQMYQCMNGYQIGEQRSYVSQCGALLHRIKYPQSYKDKFLATTDFAKISFQERQNDVIVSGLQLGQGEGFRTMDEYGYVIATNAPNPRHTYETITATNEIQFASANGAPAPTDNRDIYSSGDIVEYLDPAGGNVLTRLTIDTVGEDALFFVAVPNINAALDIGTNFKLYKKIRRPTRSSQNFELVFKPALGIWHKDVWLPSHDMELKMYPHPEGTYQKNVIQSLVASKTHDTDFKFEIQDMIMYVCLKDNKHEDGKYTCEYEDLRCQVTNITTTSNVAHHFIVDRESHSFTMALQDENSENDTRYPATKFKIRNDEEFELQRYWLEWNGRQLPNPYPVLSKTADTDFLTQRYYESTYYSGANNNYDVESLDDWENAGMYFTHRFGKGSNQTEKVNVSTLFNSGAFEDDHRPNLLLFDHFDRTFSMQVSSGRVTQVAADIVN